MNGKVIVKGSCATGDLRAYREGSEPDIVKYIKQKSKELEIEERVQEKARELVEQEMALEEKENPDYIFEDSLDIEL